MPLHPATVFSLPLHLAHDDNCVYRLFFLLRVFHPTVLKSLRAFFGGLSPWLTSHRRLPRILACCDDTEPRTTAFNGSIGCISSFLAQQLVQFKISF